MTAEGPWKRGPFFSALCGRCPTYSLADLIEDSIGETVQFPPTMSLSLSPLIRFGTSTWTYEGWQGQVYKREYPTQEHVCP